MLPAPTDKNGGNVMSETNAEMKPREGDVMSTQIPAPRKINIGTSKHTGVYALDEAGEGNASHHYVIRVQKHPDEDSCEYGHVCFQKGPVKENGINGIHNEDLIVIVMDRLQGFQKGSFRCKDNAMALTKLEEALLWLNKRTQKRTDQGVEGTNIEHKEND